MAVKEEATFCCGHKVRNFVHHQILRKTDDRQVKQVLVNFASVNYADQ